MKASCMACLRDFHADALLAMVQMLTTGAILNDQECILVLCSYSK